MAQVESMASLAKRMANRLEKLRDGMVNLGLQAYVVTSQDPHLSEYVADTDQHRAWISGFTGSNGTAVVTMDKALLWTDGRYYEQAVTELPKEWELVRASDSGVLPVPDYLASVLPVGSKVGVNADTLSVTEALDWDTSLAPLSEDSFGQDHSPNKADNLQVLVPLDDDLVEAIWESRPPRPARAIIKHPSEWSGRTTAEKVQWLRNKLDEAKADCIVLAMLDEIAWLLNLRGSDILYTPVFFSYLVLTHNNVLMFVAENSLNDETRDYLESELGKVEIHPYEDRKSVLAHLDEIVAGRSKRKSRRGKMEPPSTIRVWMDPECSSIGLHLSCVAKPHIEVIAKPSPVKREKALKDAEEVRGARKAHIYEGVALCRYFAWLEERVKEEPQIDEVEASDKLESFRALEPHYISPSFTTISAAGSNSSVIHYSPSPETALLLSKDGFYLCDTGSQYTMGTTDMTRTLCFGEPTDFQRLAYTAVLEGHVAVARAVFPEGTEPAKLDLLARTALWRHGLDYRHGTSHGLGAALGVHEYPPLMSSRHPAPEDPSPGEKYNSRSMGPGMVLSNEPGFYLPGEFGIRLENVMVSRTCEESLPHAAKFDESQRWLDFETISYIPMEPKLIDLDQLSEDALEWLNAYHKTCREVLLPFLEDETDELARSWLLNQTEPLTR